MSAETKGKLDNNQNAEELHFEDHPLSHGQRALWFMQQMNPGDGAYNMSYAWHVRSPIDTPCLIEALSHLVSRHPTLRSTYPMVDGEPVQRIHASFPVKFEEVDASDWTDDSTLENLQEEMYRPFDLGQESPVRWKYFRRKTSAPILFLHLHHMGTDVWSVMTLLNELKASYAAILDGKKPNLPPIKVQNADFVSWQNTMLESEEGKQSLQFWRKQLDGELPDLNLQTDFPRPPMPGVRGGLLRFPVSDALVQNISAACTELGCSPFMFCLTAYQALLKRFTGQSDISVGVPTAGRSEEFGDIFNYYVSPVAMRALNYGNPKYSDFLAENIKKIKEVLENQKYPFPLLVNQILETRNSSRSPVFQTQFIWENSNRFRNRKDHMVTLNEAGNEVWTLGELVLERELLNLTLDHFDLNMKMVKVGATFYGLIEYNSDLFNHESMERLAANYVTFLEEVSRDASQKIGHIDVLTDSEKKQLVVTWNDNQQDFPRDKMVPDLIEAQVAKTPNAEALMFQDEVVSYQELNDRANQLANYLRKQGVGPDVLVGVCMDRCTNLVISLLAVQKTGGAYVPLDPHYPKDRVSYMLEDAGATTLITQEKLVETFAVEGVNPICVDKDADTIAKESKDNIQRTTRGENLSHVIYTSGSTGKPKGVAVKQSNVVALIYWAKELFTKEDLSGVLASTSVCFDLSVYEIFFPLSCEGKIILVQNALHMLSMPHADKVVLINSVPSVMAELLNAEAVPASVKTVNLAGEPLPNKLVQRIYRLGTVERVFNLYGPSEDTTYSTWQLMQRGDDYHVDIGIPLSNTQGYVVDANLQLTPVGVPGELVLGGDGLSRGYLNKPHMTCEKFIPDPFSNVEGSRLYRTGDLVRYLEDGKIDYMGRIDNQVKVRGFRIELGEIEKAMEKYPEIKEAVVLAREDKPGDKRLVGYYVSEEGKEVDTDKLITAIKVDLAEYMIPSAFVALDAFPLTPNKKIDRRALPKPKEKVTAKATVSNPGNEVERTIAEIWQEVLDLDHVGMHDNFFDIGGHSLLMAKVYSKLPPIMKKKLTMVDLIQYPTIHSLALYVSDDEEEDKFFNQKDDHLERLKEARERIKEWSGINVAVVGMAGRFPGADSVEAFWDNLRNGTESITFYTDDELEEEGVNPDILKDPNYVKAQSVLSDIKGFDARFFGITPREAQITDPQQRLFLEICWSALENAGHRPSTYDGAIGVYAGVGMNNYLLSNLKGNPDVIKTVGDYMVMIGNDKDFLSSRVSYKLNLTGPSVVVQGACQTSLLAIHLACQGILNGDCSMAIAGGVSFGPLRKSGYLYKEGMIFSPDGHCRTFDEKAKGTIQGQGGAVVVLKNLEDAISDNDHIYAVIKGTGVSNDGSEKVGYTAPSAKGQAQAIKAAHYLGGITPDTVGYIEAHGTATPLGDPVEISGLKQAFGRQEKKQYCAIGSVKSNIGHLDTAAGVAGFIKASLSLDHEQIPPSLHYATPNPQIDFANSPFYVNDKLRDWKTEETPRRAGISSFGIGGTNAHIVLEEAPKREATAKDRPWHLVVLSAKSSDALNQAGKNLTHHLSEKPDLNFSDVCYTLQVGREPFAHRRMLVAKGLHDAVIELDKNEHTSYGHVSQEARAVTFMFPGQGAQYIGMGQRLYQVEMAYREEVDRCWDIIKKNAPELYDSLTERDRGAHTDKLHQTFVTQPATFVVEYALAKLLISWGVKPDAMIANSLGEYVAATLAGVFTLEEALEAVTIRGKLMQEMPPGEQVMIFLPEEEVLPMLNDELSLAGTGTPNQCMVGGSSEAISQLLIDLEKREAKAFRLFTSHAFHSYMMEPVKEKFAKAISHIQLKAPEMKFISCLTGTWITEEQATSHEYWAKQLREPVRFSQGLSTLFKDENRIFVEVGPEKLLSAVALNHSEKGRGHNFLTTMGDHQNGESEVHSLLTALGRLYLAGIDIDWHSFHKEKQRYRVPLPAYAFERTPYWIDPPKTEYEERRALEEGKDRPWKIITLSAKSANMLDATTNHFLRVVKSHPQLDLSDVSYTLHMGRQDLKSRRFLLAKSLDGVIKSLENRENLYTANVEQNFKPVTFMFSGQGSQYLNMGKVLYRHEPIFRKTVDQCWDILRDREPDFYKDLSADDRAFKTDKISQTYMTQPSLFIVEYSMSQVLINWGIRPQAMIGHSIGEYVAACLTGVFTLEAALSLVVARGRLMQSCQPGDMLSIRKPEAEVLPFLNENLSMAVINSPKNCVVSGPEDAIADLAERLSKEKIACRTIHTSHAFHSHMMEPILQEFTNLVSSLEPNPPILPFISNVTGTWITESQATSPEYWAQHLRQAVRFSQGLEVLFREKDRIFIEVGPGNVLTKLAKSNPAKAKTHQILPTMIHPKEENLDDVSQLLTTVGQLWLEGIRVDWDEFNIDKKRETKPLLNFDGSSPAIGIPQAMPDLEPDEIQEYPDEDDAHYRPNVNSEYVAPEDSIEEKIATIWKEYMGLDEIGIHDDYFELGGDSMLATQLVPALSEAFDIPLASNTLMARGTVALLAEFIRELHADPESSRKSSIILEIKHGKGSMKPLYMVHPIGGDIYFYRDLPNYLGPQQPVYAFQAPSLVKKGDPMDNVKEQAALYVKELLEFDPDGEPYLIGGASYGGIVAYEMAQQMMAQGKKVDIVVIVDAPAPGEMPAELSDSAAILEYLLYEQFELDTDELRKLSLDDQIRFVREKARANNIPDPLPESVVQNLFPTWLAHQRGMLAYEPQEINCPVLYFRHTERMAYFPQGANETWRNWCNSKFEDHQIPGTHITMNFSPHVKLMAKHIKRALGDIATGDYLD